MRSTAWPKKLLKLGEQMRAEVFAVSETISDIQIEHLSVTTSNLTCTDVLFLGLFEGCLKNLDLDGRDYEDFVLDSTNESLPITARWVEAEVSSLSQTLSELEHALCEPHLFPNDRKTKVQLERIVSRLQQIALDFGCAAELVVAQ